MVRGEHGDNALALDTHGYYPNLRSNSPSAMSFSHSRKVTEHINSTTFAVQNIYPKVFSKIQYIVGGW